MGSRTEKREIGKGSGTDAGPLQESRDEIKKRAVGPFFIYVRNEPAYFFSGALVSLLSPFLAQQPDFSF